jgi:hypothetical protein
MISPPPPPPPSPPSPLFPFSFLSFSSLFSYSLELRIIFNFIIIFNIKDTTLLYSVYLIFAYSSTCIYINCLPNNFLVILETFINISKYFFSQLLLLYL